MSKKIVIATAAMTLMAAGSVFAGQTGGDKGRPKADNSTTLSQPLRRSTEPPDPLTAHKSPGRTKRPTRRHHHKHRILAGHKR